MIKRIDYIDDKGTIQGTAYQRAGQWEVWVRTAEGRDLSVVDCYKARSEAAACLEGWMEKRGLL